jgi:GDPmannose 4,6-dehydratase|tara:strand:- start:871 stop:1848 length:978 start_codon:yes stop_codon:yes gene_type:complete
MSKKALITGIAGQDGSYLAEHLLTLGYEVHGIVRRNSTSEHQESRIDHVSDQINTHYGDLLDYSSISGLVNQIKPDEIYNLGAQSHVRISFEIPEFTGNVNALGVLNVLSAIKEHSPESKMYQASSSEMFGDSVDDDMFQRETTPMHPVSPYGCAKLYGYHITRNYRKAYGLFAANGILFNHESPRRGSNFVTSKVVKTACEIKVGKKDRLELGNMDSSRDWGHSKDYVRAMVKILEQDEPQDFVIATGQTHTVRDLVNLVFDKLDLEVDKYVFQNPKFLRPSELPYLKGDSSKARKALDWRPEISFEQLVDEMVESWLSRLTRE